MRYELREMKWQERYYNYKINFDNYINWKINMNAPTKRILTAREENDKFITCLMRKYRGGNSRNRVALCCFMKGWY